MKDGCNIDKFGTKIWYKNNKFHREDGPAFEFTNGIKYWYLYGKRHRIDGPAAEYTNGKKEWFLNGNKYSEEEHLFYVRKIKLNNL